MTIRDEILAFLESHPGDQTTADISAACECKMTWPLTPWYPATTKPVRPGVYLVRTEMEWPRETMNLWTGEKWVSLDGIVNLQFLFDAHWRGLAFDPVAVERIIDAECYPQRVRYLWVVPAP